MNVLHLFRSPPKDNVATVLRNVFDEFENKETALYSGDVDYDQLIKDIFTSDKVISWW